MRIVPPPFHRHHTIGRDPLRQRRCGLSLYILTPGVFCAAFDTPPVGGYVECVVASSPNFPPCSRRRCHGVAAGCVGNNIPINDAGFEVLESIEACAERCILYGSACVSYDWGLTSLRCYLGSGRAGNDGSNTGSSSYRYYEILAVASGHDWCDVNKCIGIVAPTYGTIGGCSGSLTHGETQISMPPPVFMPASAICGILTGICGGVQEGHAR